MRLVEDDTRCGECLSPNEDPAPWCDCRGGEPPCSVPCRQRAHDPEDCPTLETGKGDLTGLEIPDVGEIYSGLPLRWRHVLGGDVLIVEQDDDEPPEFWFVISVSEWKGIVTATASRAGHTERSDVDPDGSVTVLAPVRLHEAMLVLREELGATVAWRKPTNLAPR